MAVHTALEKKEHHRTVSDLEQQEELAVPRSGSQIERGKPEEEAAR